MQSYCHFFLHFHDPMNPGLPSLVHCLAGSPVFYAFFDCLSLAFSTLPSTPLVPFKLFLFLPDTQSTCSSIFLVPH